MPKPGIPSYRLHKATGQAVVVHKGKSHYLGKFGTLESRVAYDRVIADILARRNAPPSNNSQPNAIPAPAVPLLVSELILRYWKFATGYYVKDGRPTGELHPLRQALRLLRRHCGGHPVTTVGPLAIKEIQQAMVRQPVTRRVKVRGRTGRSPSRRSWSGSG